MKQIQIDLSPEEYASEAAVRRAVARALGVAETVLDSFRITRRSIDCRRRNVLYHCTVEIGPNTPNTPIILNNLTSTAPRLVIVGAGPAGLFAALRALQLGMKPIIIERGKPVQERKKDIVNLVRTKEVNPDSNWCFGEGGAGPIATVSYTLAPPSAAMSMKCYVSLWSMVPTLTSWSTCTPISAPTACPLSSRACAKQ